MTARSVRRPTAVVTGTGIALPGVESTVDLLARAAAGAGPAAGPRAGEPVDPVDPAARIGKNGLLYKDRATQLALVAGRDALVDSGLLVRGPGPDGRTRGLSLSDDGATMAEEMLRARRDALEGVVGQLSAGEAHALERALRALLPLLPGDREAAHRICRLCEHDVCRGDDCVVSTAVGR